MPKMLPINNADARAAIYTDSSKSNEGGKEDEK